MSKTINENLEFKGYNGTLILTDSGVVIKRGLKGFLLGGGMIRGDKTIPYKSIVAVQLKRAKWTAGYIQLTLVGGTDATSGLFQSTKDENSINFHDKQNDAFEEAKRIIEEKINEKSGSRSSLDELEKLAELKDKGIITEEEFKHKKKRLLEME